MTTTIYVPTDPKVAEGTHFVIKYYRPDHPGIEVNEVTLTPERINQCIHDICVLQEKLWEATHIKEIFKLEARQREAILSLIKGEK